MHELLCLARGGRHRSDVAVALNVEAGHRFARRCNSIYDTLRPHWLNTDDDAGRDIRIGSGANHRTEVQIKVCAELQPAISVGQGDRALYMSGDGFAGCVRDIVQRQNDYMVAHADATIFAAISPDGLRKSTHALPALGF